ncbi:RelA/SpoT family protein [Allostreptomyces psammosilenae]|uniref:GTP pyrophosphokinase n=1 Tax=Allostreptomyces psammosilenae TaxID=1892865 RepID=A0A852ZWQ7_9ACTN|nr:HD domain-containing protein [Allostreptomyces psammosilenae]NYI03091.1 GTP pyrophosphokinase [Allostreptomyces psammosilenae]
MPAAPGDNPDPAAPTLPPPPSPPAPASAPAPEPAGRVGTRRDRPGLITLPGRVNMATAALLTSGLPNRRGGAPEVPHALQPIVRVHRAHHPRADLGVLHRAYLLAERCHRGQLRKSGGPFITHPLAVAMILAQLGAETTTLAAALLHDTVEDTDLTLRQVREHFGPEVAYLVDGVTKLRKVDFGAAAEAETFRKMLVATGDDLRVMVIKLADRLHNMRTIQHMKPSSQVRIAKVTRDVLIPLAERLGVQTIKAELEDTVFATLHPEEYARTRAMITAHEARPDDPLADLAAEVGRALREARVPAEVRPYARHCVSTHRVRLRRGGDRLGPYDFGRLLVLVERDRDCYAALGVLHTRYTPVAGGFTDYVATPKFNLYQSLHTSVATAGGDVVETLIRTHRMHRVAEYGVVALHAEDAEAAADPTAGAADIEATEDGSAEHGAAGAPGSAGPVPLVAGEAPGPDAPPRPGLRQEPDPAPADAPRTGPAERPGRPEHPDRAAGRGRGDRPARPGWLTRLLRWQLQAPDPDTFWSSLTAEMAEDQEITVLSTDGRTLQLPPGATCVDAAYALGERTGHGCVAARLNGRLVSLSARLGDGDVVELLSSPGEPSGPSPSWLHMARTPVARIAIARWLEQHGTATGGTGRPRAGTAPGTGADVPDRTGDVPDRTGAGDRNADGDRAGSRPRDAPAAPDGAARPARRRPRRPEPAAGILRVPGHAEAPVRLSRCCTPVPPDPLVGYLLRRGTVAAHRRDCAEGEAMRRAGRAVVRVEWVPGARARHRVTLQAEALSRPGLLADVTAALCDADVAVVAAEVGPPRAAQVRHTYTVELADPARLPELMRAVRRVPGVYDVYRARRPAPAHPPTSPGASPAARGWGR